MDTAFFITSSMLMFILFISPSHSNSSNNSNKVNLSLYYESLCPYCQDFIVNQLRILSQNSDLNSIINLRLIPWGNTQRIANNDWICQHGPNECLLNEVEACAIYLWPAPKVHLKLIQCIERLSSEGKENQWASCLGEQQLNQELMNNCYRSAAGLTLELRHAYETENLKPPHTFVPWVLVNDRALEQDYQNYITYVCKAYTGPIRPAVCYRPLETNLQKRPNSLPQVCYARKEENLAPLAAEDKKVKSANDSSTDRKETPT